MDEILSCLNNGNTKKETLELLRGKGYTGSLSNTYEYFRKVEELADKEFEPHPYVRTKRKLWKTMREALGKNMISLQETVYFSFYD